MSSNKIYIVAGERNIMLAKHEIGLWANVGQTTRDVSERLRDDDYKRKAAGGRWQILFTQDVGENLTDKQIHPFLKQHPDVEWDHNSDNTEEFLFKGDQGDGSVARRIVGEILRRVCLPILQDENVKLQNEVSRLQLELQDSNETVASLLSEDAIRESLARIVELEDTNKQMLEDAKQTDTLVKDTERKYKELQDKEDRRIREEARIDAENHTRSERRWALYQNVRDAIGFALCIIAAILMFIVIIIAATMPSRNTSPYIVGGSALHEMQNKSK